MYLLSPLVFVLIVLLEIFSNSINKAMVIEHRNQERLTTFTTQNAENEFSLFSILASLVKKKHTYFLKRLHIMEITYFKEGKLNVMFLDKIVCYV